MDERRTPTFDDLNDHTGGQPEVAWWRAAAINGGGITLAIGTLLVIWLLAWPITLLLIAIIIAQALMPVVNWLSRWLPRALATVAVYLVLMATLAGIIWLILPDILEQGQLMVDNAPAAIDTTREWLRSLDPEAVDRMTSALETIVQNLGNILLSAPLTIFDSVISIILIVFMSIHWLIAAPSLQRFALSLFPRQHRERAGDVM